MSEQEPLAEIQLNGKGVTLLGTAHVSKASAEKVEQMLDSGQFDAVAVELCPSRKRAIIDPEHLHSLDLFRVIREGKAAMVFANLALGAYQQRMADELGIEPGAEMRMAVHSAKEKNLPVLLIDREIGTTLKRLYRNIPWWQRLTLFAGLLTGLITHEKISEEEVEKLKEGDMLEATLYQFAEHNPALYRPLINERDLYMSAMLRKELVDSDLKKVLVVIGAGHLKGMKEELAKPLPTPEENAAVLEELDRIPPGSRWVRWIPWLIVALVVAGFALGFSRSPSLGWQMIADWVLINGGLSALGALFAGGHPLTIATAFLAAPLTSLNPMIGAGLVTAAAELWLRKPTVGDFGRLKKDAATLKGWWRNRVARTLLIFMLSNVGSAIGTYVAGYSIFERLTG